MRKYILYKMVGVPVDEIHPHIAKNADKIKEDLCSFLEEGNYLIIHANWPESNEIDQIDRPWTIVETFTIKR